VVPTQAEVSLDFGRSALKADEFSFDEILEVARAARELITASRPIDIRDLVLPQEASGAGTFDLTDLQGRADRAVGRLQDASAFTAKPPAKLEKIREGLLAIANLGVHGSVPLSASGTGQMTTEILKAQVASIDKELKSRLDALKKEDDKFAQVQNPNERQKLDYHLARLGIVLGPGFRVLPRFKPAAAKASELDRAFKDSDLVQGTDPEESALTWFTRIARVREGVARLETVLLYGEAMQTQSRTFRVLQLPYQPNDRWVARQLQAGERLPGGRLSLVVHAPSALDLTQYLAGQLVDELVEVVPNTSETTGVTFHYDAPDAEPPQAILLAVPPDPSKPWDLETLEAVLLEALDLTKIRAVDPDALQGIGQFLPALYFAYNAEGDTVTTDFMRNFTSKPPGD
jgi:hypothetical protein